MKKTLATLLFISSLATGVFGMTTEGVEPEQEGDDLAEILPIFMQSPKLGSIMASFLSDLAFVKDEAVLPEVLKNLTRGISAIFKEHAKEIENGDFEKVEQAVLARQGSFIEQIEQAAASENPNVLDLMRLKRGLNNILGSGDYRDYDGHVFDEAFMKVPQFKKVMGWLSKEFERIKDDETFSATFKQAMEKIKDGLDQNREKILDNDIQGLQSFLQENLVGIQNLFETDTPLDLNN